MKKFIAKDYFQLYNETPFRLVSPTTAGFLLIVQYLKQKYDTEIIRADVDFYWMDQIEKNIYLFNEQVNAVRATQGDYRFSWVPGTTHALNLVYVREQGEEALFYSDSNRNPDATIPDFAQKLSALTGLPVYATSGNRQAALRGCYTDALVFAREITGRDKKTGAYRIPNFLSVLKKRAKQLGTSSFEVKLPDELLKTTQISKFLNAHKESDNRVIHKNETLLQFRTRYTKEAVIEDQKKSVATYLTEKGYKYRDIMQIQFYLNQMPYLSEEQKKMFIKEAKNVLKSNANGLYDFAIQRATELGYPPVPAEHPFLRAALSPCNESTVFHEIVAEQTFSDLQTFYELIPNQFHLRVLTNPDKTGNTGLHWSSSYADKFKYLLSSLTETETVGERTEALTAPGENNNTTMHWIASNPELFEFALNSIHKTRMLHVLTTAGQNGNTVLHWLEGVPDLLILALNHLPKDQILEAITVPGQDGASLLHWIKAKPASLNAVLSCLSAEEREAVETVLKKGLPATCVELRKQIQDYRPQGSKPFITSPEPFDSTELKINKAVQKSGDSTFLHEMVAKQSLNDLQEFYDPIPSQFRLKVITNREQRGNTALHWASSHPDKFKYLLSSLTETETVGDRADALMAFGENDNTPMHWIASNPDLFEFALNSIHKSRLLRVLTTPGQNGNTVLHWLSNAPESLKLALNHLPKEQRLEAITSPGQEGASLLHWVQEKPASLNAVLSCLSAKEREAVEAVLKKGLPATCAELRKQIQENCYNGPNPNFFSSGRFESPASGPNDGLKPRR